MNESIFEWISSSIVVSSGVSVASSTISSIDVLSEDLNNQKFGRLYRRWLKCANRAMKQPEKQVKQNSSLSNRWPIDFFVLVRSTTSSMHWRSIYHQFCSEWNSKIQVNRNWFFNFDSNEISFHRYFEEFFCTHAPLIETHFQKIMNAAEAHINDRNSVAAALLDVRMKCFDIFHDEIFCYSHFFF